MEATFSRPIVLDSEAIANVQRYVTSRGGLYRAALSLHVYESTLRKILEGVPISVTAAVKLQRIVGDIERFRVQFSEQAQTEERQAELSVAEIRSKQHEVVKQLVAFVTESGGNEAAASRLGIRISTVEKILADTQVSRSVYSRIGTLLERKDFKDSNGLSEEKEARLREVHQLYLQLGTLEAVGAHLSLTRERVRQLLAQGHKKHLFEYKPRNYPYVAKETLIADFIRFGNIGPVARANNVSTGYVQRLFTAYRMRPEDLERLRRESRKEKCRREYREIKQRLGHDPTTTELQNGTPGGRALGVRIVRYWGSTDAFRAELDIQAPRQGSPKFEENTRQWREQQKRLALMRRLHHLDIVREFMARHGGRLSARSVADECTLSPGRINVLLRMLTATGEVRRMGEGAQTKYLLIR